MGTLVNRRSTTWLVVLVAAVILLLNLVLLYSGVVQALVPGLPAIPGVG